MAGQIDSQIEAVVSLTENAARHIKSLQAEQPDHTAKPLRVYVEGGGCAGMQYGMVFDESRPDDLTGDFYGVTVVVDPFSANYVHGAVIDYVSGLNGGFRFSNPKARSTCACGKSFEA